MKNVLFAILVLSVSPFSYGQSTVDTTAIKKSIEQFKIDLVGPWHSHEQGPSIHQIGAVFDTILYNSLPFKARDKIVFYKNGFFQVNDTSNLKRYEVAKKAYSINYKGSPFWTYLIKLDGVDYFAHFNNGSLSLGYNYGTGSWSQLLERKK